MWSSASGVSIGSLARSVRDVDGAGVSNAF
jgi:hypothetical protein